MTATDDAAGGDERGGGASRVDSELDPRFDPAYQRGFDGRTDGAASAPRAANGLPARPRRAAVESMRSAPVGAGADSDERPRVVADPDARSLLAPHPKVGRRASPPVPDRDPAARSSPLSENKPGRQPHSPSSPFSSSPLVSPAAGAALRALWIAGTALVLIAVAVLAWSSDPQLTFWTGDAPPVGYLWAQIATSTAPHILWVGLVTLVVAVAATAARRASVATHLDGTDDDDDPFYDR